MNLLNERDGPSGVLSAFTLCSLARLSSSSLSLCQNSDFFTRIKLNKKNSRKICLLPFGRELGEGEENAAIIPERCVETEAHQAKCTEKMSEETEKLMQALLNTTWFRKEPESTSIQV